MEIQSLEICRHRYGKRMTYTEQTDGLHYEESYLWMREMLVKRGIKAGVFVSLKDFPFWHSRTMLSEALLEQMSIRLFTRE